MKQKNIILLSLITTSVISQNLYSDILFYYNSAILPTIIAKKIPKPTIQSATVVDGYLVYSEACMDVNKNNFCDADEPMGSFKNNPQGKFTLPETTQKGPLFFRGGRYGNISKYYRGSFTAPFNSSVISPLTSAVYSLMSTQGKSLKEADSIVKATFGLEDLDASLVHFNSILEIKSNDEEIRNISRKTIAYQTQIQVLALSAAITISQLGAGLTYSVMPSVFDEIVIKMQRDKKLPDAHELAKIIKKLADKFYPDAQSKNISIKAVAANAAKKAVSLAKSSKDEILNGETDQTIALQRYKNIEFTQDLYYKLVAVVDKTGNKAAHEAHYDPTALDEIILLQAEESDLTTQQEEAYQALRDANREVTRLNGSKNDSLEKFEAYVEAKANKANKAVAFAQAQKTLALKMVEVAKAENLISEFSRENERVAYSLKTIAVKKLSNASNDLRVANAALDSVKESIANNETLAKTQELAERAKQNTQDKFDVANAEVAEYIAEAQLIADKALVDAKEAREIADYYMRGEDLALKAEEAAQDAQRAVGDINIIITANYNTDEAKLYVEEAQKQAATVADALSSMAYIKENGEKVAKNAPTRVQAIKLLRQGSYTSYETQIDFIMRNGEMAWIDKQLDAKSAFDDPDVEYYGYIESFVRRNIEDNPRHFKPYMLESPETTYPESIKNNSELHVFYKDILPKKMFDSEDQLRQRMALALNEIIVVSTAATAGPSLWWHGIGLVKMYDDLYEHSFGNYRDVLKSASMSGAMAYYLTFLGNMKENAFHLGRQLTNAPDENFARELMQLFSIGVYELNIDGSKKLDSEGQPIPSYTQEDVSQLARVFTGWDWWSGPNSQSHGNVYGSASTNLFNLIHDNQFTPKYHEFGEKFVLGTKIEAVDISDLTNEEQVAHGEADIDAVIDILMNNANIAPHVSRHLIMRLVTSNPSPAYIERVATAFNDGLYNDVGTGKKGDLKVTVEAILKDDEARGINAPKDFGKTDEYLLAYTHFASRLNVSPLPYLIDSAGNRNYNKYTASWWGGIAQLPLGAPSVFNHYMNDDAPSDDYFMSNGLVGPELATRSNGGNRGIIAKTSRKTYDAYEQVELNYAINIPQNQAQTLDEWLHVAHPSTGWMFNSKDIYDEYLPIRDEAWDKGPRERKEATSELIDILSRKFIGEELPADYKALILEKVHVDREDSTYDNLANRPDNLINRITSYITISPKYMNLR